MTTNVTPSMPIRVISLPRAAERQARIGAALAELGLTYEIFSGVDARLLTDGDWKREYDHARRLVIKGYPVRPLCAPELGCALAHRSLYDAVVAGGWPGVLALEDDASPGPSLPRILARLAVRFPADQPVVVLLTHLKRYFPAGEPLDDGCDLVRVARAVYTYAYFLTRAAAGVLRSVQKPVSLYADDWEEFRRFVPVYGLNPYAVSSATAEASHIDDARNQAVERWRRGRWRRRLRPLVLYARAWHAARRWKEETRGAARVQPEEAFKP